MTSRWKIVIIKTTAFAVVFLIVQKTSFPYDKKRAARMRTPGELDVEFASGVTAVPYHAGAAKYFAEKGFDVPTK